MYYKVEWLNGEGDWILKSWHKNESNATANAEVQATAGFTSRIIYEGQIIKYFDKE